MMKNISSYGIWTKEIRTLRLKEQCCITWATESDEQKDVLNPCLNHSVIFICKSYVKPLHRCSFHDKDDNLGNFVQFNNNLTLAKQELNSGLKQWFIT